MKTNTTPPGPPSSICSRKAQVQYNLLSVFFCPACDHSLCHHWSTSGSFYNIILLLYVFPIERIYKCWWERDWGLGRVELSRNQPAAILHRTTAWNKFARATQIVFRRPRVFKKVHTTALPTVLCGYSTEYNSPAPPVHRIPPPFTRRGIIVNNDAHTAGQDNAAPAQLD